MPELVGHITLFLDILGWGRRLLEYDAVPGFAHEQQRVDRVVGEPIRQRKTVDTILRAWINEDRAPSWKRYVRALPKEQFDSLSTMMQHKWIYQSFSDCFAISVRFAAPPEAGIAALEHLLILSTSVVPMLMEAQVPVRGGLEIGWGTVERGELVGSSLVGAYELESTVAKHPRIVVGPKIVQLLRRYQLDSEPLIRRQGAARTAGYIFEDHDGAPTLDYLGSQAVEFHDWRRTEQGRSMLQNAYKYVRTERQDARETGNDVLLKRWSLVRRYFLDNLGRNWLMGS